jgi:hypothetical protein
MRLNLLLSLSEAPRLPWKTPEFIEKMKAAGINPASPVRDILDAAKSNGVQMNAKTALDFRKFLTDLMVRDGSFHKWNPI